MLSISVTHGFPWGTSPNGHEDPCLHRCHRDPRPAPARQLAAELISLRAPFERPSGIDTALDQALASPAGPVVIADGADDPGGGAAGDSTFLLRRLIERGITSAALGPLWDPIAVRIAFEAGVGARLALRVGGKIGPLSGDPLETLECTVNALHANLKMSGLSGIRRQSLGDCALIN